VHGALEVAGQFIYKLKPDQLVNDPDLALEFEVEIIMVARARMKTLELYWPCRPNEILSTGWSIDAVKELSCGHFPYR
jgi:hypothetical protein